jgi:signal transduction histidine kinase
VLLPWRSSYIVLLAITLAYVSAVFIFSHSLQTVWEGLPTFVAGLVFIVVFTQMALNEEASRREVERLVNELTIANQRLREYADEVEELATIRERNRLAREIHDGLGHYLTTIHMQIQAAAAVGQHDPKKAQEMLAKAQTLAQKALDDVRESVSALRERSNELNTPLPEMIRKIIEDTISIDIQPNFTILGEPRRINPEAQWTLYRAAQEGVSNICRHSQASEYSIVLSYMDPDSISLTVLDNGVGSDELSEGYGLIGLRERVSHLNGSLTIINDHEQGFGFEVKLPG